MNNTSKPTRCPRCDETGYIGFFRVHTVSSADQKYHSGSFAAARCSCPAGHALWDGIKFFDDIPEFTNEPHRTHFQYAQQALASEQHWLSTIHWPRLLRILPEGAQKRRIAQAIKDTPNLR